jgi:putative ABC transport system permease protein
MSLISSPRTGQPLQARDSEALARGSAPDDDRRLIPERGQLRLQVGEREPAEVAAAIDRIFDEKDVQTLSMSERSMANSFLGMVSAVFQAIDVVSGVILVIMMLILGNTIAMGVRERTGEYGVLRAIGFLPRHLALLVLGEGLAVGVLGGVLGLWLTWLVVGVLGRWIEENMGAYFPYFRLQGGVAAMAMGISMLLSTAASALPAYRASRLRVIEALRRTA